jgi:hypothetical protein
MTVKPFKKLVRLGTMQRWQPKGSTRKPSYYSIYCKIHWLIDPWSDEPCNHPAHQHLSIVGTEGPTPGGNAYGGTGQIDGELRKYYRKIRPAPGWDHSMIYGLLEIWDKHHLKERVPEQVLTWLQALPDADRKMPGGWGRW